MRVSIAILALITPSVLSAVIKQDTNEQSTVDKNGNDIVNNVKNAVQRARLNNAVDHREVFKHLSSKHSIAASVSAVTSVSKKWPPVSQQIQSVDSDLFPLPVEEKAPLSKIELTVNGVYFSQTDSYRTPDLSSLDSSNVKVYPDFPNDLVPTKDPI